MRLVSPVPVLVPEALHEKLSDVDGKPGPGSACNGAGDAPPCGAAQQQDPNTSEEYCQRPGLAPPPAGSTPHSWMIPRVHAAG